MLRFASLRAAASAAVAAEALCLPVQKHIRFRFPGLEGLPERDAANRAASTSKSVLIHSLLSH